MAEIRWESPPEFRCNGCRTYARGALGSYMSGDTVSLPAGWSRGFDRQAKKELYACSERCRLVVDVERKMGG